VWCRCWFWCRCRFWCGCGRSCQLRRRRGLCGGLRCGLRLGLGFRRRLRRDIGKCRNVLRLQRGIIDRHIGNRAVERAGVILRPRPAPVRQGTELGRLGAGGLGIGRRGTVHLLAVHEERNLVAVEGDRDMGLRADANAVKAEQVGLVLALDLHPQRGAGQEDRHVLGVAAVEDGVAGIEPLHRGQSGRFEPEGDGALGDIERVVVGNRQNVGVFAPDPDRILLVEHCGRAGKSLAHRSQPRIKIAPWLLPGSPGRSMGDLSEKFVQLALRPGPMPGPGGAAIPWRSPDTWRPIWSYPLASTS
jgi:hypothetical protein